MKIVAKYLKTAIFDNYNKKHRQQNNGKVHLKEFAKKPFRAKKKLLCWFDDEKYKTLLNEADQNC